MKVSSIPALPTKATPVLLCGNIVTLFGKIPTMDLAPGKSLIIKGARRNLPISY
jgi:hypothetical protein